ncbi:hypothetical protein D4764_22G0002880 [Takifugu flavidus]|uniref:Uncharacterized protein n=1 Tax=Takifugu flavidus TaxID=433684 RepID=A0A5C6NDQ8_9TELE|nr:hypothetical protein D4764_22G0002880 [Takifugu flavidus]
MTQDGGADTRSGPPLSGVGAEKLRVDVQMLFIYAINAAVAFWIYGRTQQTSSQSWRDFGTSDYSAGLAEPRPRLLLPNRRGDAGSGVRESRSGASAEEHGLMTTFHSSLVEFIILKCRPFYLPREFTAMYGRCLHPTQLEHQQQQRGTRRPPSSINDQQTAPPGDVHRLLRARDSAYRDGDTVGPATARANLSRGIRDAKTIQQENIRTLQQHQRCTEPVEGHPEPVEGYPEPVEGHPEPVEGHPEPVEGHPEPH